MTWRRYAIMLPLAVLLAGTWLLKQLSAGLTFTAGALFDWSEG